MLNCLKAMSGRIDFCWVFEGDVEKKDEAGEEKVKETGEERCIIIGKHFAVM